MRSLRKLQKQRVQLEEQSKQIQSHTATCITDSHDEDDGNDEDDDDNTLTAANITTNVFNLVCFLHQYKYSFIHSFNNSWR